MEYPKGGPRPMPMRASIMAMSPVRVTMHVPLEEGLWHGLRWLGVVRGIGSASAKEGVKKWTM